MANRVLPSREEAANRSDQLRAEGLSFTAEYLALDAIASGRLVDREAIDYEAAAAMLTEHEGAYLGTYQAADIKPIIDTAFGFV